MILHIMIDDKFTPEYINFINKCFSDKEKHWFYIITTHKPLKHSVNEEIPNVRIISKNIISCYKILIAMLKARGIILHGLFIWQIMILLLISNSCQKSIWVLWGGDLYNFNNEKKSLFKLKKEVISRLYGITTAIEGDCDYARTIYGFKGKFYPNICYPSNITHYDSNLKEEKRKYTILIGNSADPSNRHRYIVDKLHNIDLRNTKIIVPLSYGASDFEIELIETYIKDKLNGEILCLKKFINKDEYNHMLYNVDVALFAHKRQQALGNIINLLISGAKVYMCSDITTYSWFVKKKIKVFDIDDLDQKVLTSLSCNEKKKNNELIQAISNESQLLLQWKLVFNELINQK